MTDRSKTAWVLGGATLTMFSPLAMVLAGYPIPMFQNLGFARGTMAPPIAWILATIVGIVYALYTMRAIPFIASMQREVSLFKLLGILSAVVGGIVEEVFFRRWIMDNFMSGGFNPILQVVISGVAFGLAHASWTLLAKRDFKATLPAIMSTSILGISLAIIYLAGGRNLGPCIFAHVLINIVIEPWLMLSAVSGKWRT
ncbi:CPBP family intramembrane glutamic endopeptidase [Candidatus Amarolinea dominans]|uniref:CPBP family intramembrane glutamic endopeptidase n=1 Tax=Candidatus Amarolinea dominans TaxID=3140696 RepID=UPI001D3CE980|nr:CPBP family intramembrane metalloprotease [Anaerolineae bacterium]